MHVTSRSLVVLVERQRFIIYRRKFTSSKRYPARQVVVGIVPRIRVQDRIVLYDGRPVFVK